jgi:hypothetical protein
LIALALLSLLPSGIQAAADGATDQPLLAVVGETRITADDLFREMQRRPPTFAEYTEVHHREPDLGFDLAITGIRVNWSLVEKGTDWRFDDSGWDSRTARLG